jgi:hypothetical protein
MIAQIRGIKHRVTIKFDRIENNIAECTIATANQDFVVYLTNSPEHHLKGDLMCLHFEKLNNLKMMTTFLEENLVIFRENS